MAEYIEREKAYEKCGWYNTVNGKSICAARKDELAAIPAADVAPVRHGRWECGKPCPVCGRDRFDGLDADIWADWEPPYCPNCGAKMDGSSNEE